MHQVESASTKQQVFVTIYTCKDIKNFIHLFADKMLFFEKTFDNA